MPRLLLSLPLALALAIPAAGGDWPQWRGPARDGHAPDARLPAKWPGSAPEPTWRVKIGEGYSGAAVAGGKVFALARDDTKGVEIASCFDLANGKHLWQLSYTAPFKAPDPTAGRGPNATPTADGDRVYFFGLAGMLTCVEIATGKVLWRHDCLKEYWGVKKGADGDDEWFPPCGASASPLVDGNTVIVPIGGKKAGAVTGFDRATGKLLWKALDDRSSYASPIVASPGGIKQIVAFTGTRMVGLRHSDRELLWEEPFKAHYEQTIICPVVWKDRVVIGGEQRATFALKLTRDGDKMKAARAWKSDDLKMYLTTPVVLGDHLIGFDHRTSRLVCLSLEDGSTAWTSPAFGTKHLSFVAAGETLLILTLEGNLIVARASGKEYEQLARWKVSEKGAWAHPAVAGNRLLVKGPEELLCYELR
ncbi:MAG: PQQ-like beta-propeller repeat protein [Planctomycetes bacterium]|nr:PQQ-like beta-propeller repeat protein [Planctomycetota bacterium]